MATETMDDTDRWLMTKREAFAAWDEYDRQLRTTLSPSFSPSLAGERRANPLAPIFYVDGWLQGRAALSQDVWRRVHRQLTERFILDTDNSSSGPLLLFVVHDDGTRSLAKPQDVEDFLAAVLGEPGGTDGDDGR